MLNFKKILSRDQNRCKTKIAGFFAERSFFTFTMATNKDFVKSDLCHAWFDALNESIVEQGLDSKFNGCTKEVCTVKQNCFDFVFQNYSPITQVGPKLPSSSP